MRKMLVQRKSQAQRRATSCGTWGDTGIGFSGREQNQPSSAGFDRDEEEYGDSSEFNFTREQLKALQLGGY